MDFIKKLKEVYGETTINIAFTFKKGEATASIQAGEINPLTVTGKEEEMTTEKFFEILEEPIKELNEINTNIEQVKKAAKKKKDETTKTATGKKTSKKKEEKKEEGQQDLGGF